MYYCHSMKTQFKKWYLILSAIWAIFWVIDIFLLVPIHDSFANGVVAVFSDLYEFSFVWTIVSAPFQLFCLYILLSKLFKKS